MPDDTHKNPTIEMLVDEINTLKSTVSKLETENVNLRNDMNDLVAVNRKLLSKEVEQKQPDNDKEAMDKLDKFLKGD